MKKRQLLLDVFIIAVTNICIIIFGIWISAVPVTKSKSFYTNQFEDNSVAVRRIERRYDNVDGKEVMDAVADLTIDYYFGNTKEYQLMIGDEELFNEYEMRHMEDVKVLYVGGQIIAVIAFMILIACLFYLARHFRRIKKRLVFTTLGVYVAILVFLGIFVLISYNQYVESDGQMTFFYSLFVNFHHLIFPNEDKFLLATSQGPYQGKLYMLTSILNTEFFMNAGIIIGIVTVSVVLIWFITIFVFCKKHKKICMKVDSMHERAKDFEQRMHQA